MKVIVKCYLLEIGIALMAGVYIGRYYERQSMLDSGEITTEQISKKSKKSIRLENGELIFSLGGK